jgi:hypothetical protein
MPHSHLGVVGGHNLHSLKQGGLQRSTNYGSTHHRPSEVRKSKLMDQALTPFLYRYPSPVTNDCIDI